MHTFPHGRRLAVVTFALVLVATIAPLSLLATPALPPPVPLAIKPPPDGYFELPFWVVPGGARQVNVTTSWSYSCYTFRNPLTDTIKLTDAQCTATLLDYSHRNNADAMEWGRNYNGIFTQHVIEALGGPRLIALNHGENKNENIEGECGQGGTCFQNTINQDVHCASCASGYCGGGYSDCWDAYNSLVNLSWQDFDAEHDYGMQLHHDEGPIVWPANGYTYGGQKSSWGVRHPHGIVDGDYIWVFYLDSSKGAGNRGFGIKVARAPITSGGLPGNWQSYCAGQWVASLPPGFSRDQIQDFYPQRGGCASPILPEGMNYISFAVAKLTDGGYLGVDEHLDEHGQWKWQAGLWASTNLVTWQQIGVVEQNTSGYAAGVLHYPVFLSENGWHSDAVTLADFYVLGAQAGVVHALHMSLTPAPTPTRTPTPPPTATRTPTPTPTVTPPPLTPQARLPYLQR